MTGAGRPRQRRPHVGKAVLALVLCAAAPARLLAGPALDLPSGAVPTQTRTVPYGDLALPVGPWSEGKFPALTLSGAVDEQSWRLPGSGADTFALMERLSKGLTAQGYLPIFACTTDACGGFDFRYRLTVMPEPAMHVDLGDFRYLSAIRGRGDGASYVGLLVSRMGDTGFVQLSHVGKAATVAGASSAALPEVVEPATPPTEPATAPTEPATAPAPERLADALDQTGHDILGDLTFASGSSDLQPGSYTSLGELARYLADHPDRQVIIVGHTDVSGSLAANLALSQRRATSVANRLVERYGSDRARIIAEGAGPLAPVATNLTEEGRAKNRRVEAVLASTR